MTDLFENPDVHRTRWFLLGVLSLSLLLIVMSVAGLNVALASIQRDLGVGATGLQWITNAYTLVFGGLLLSAGAVGDRFGRKAALEAGLFIFGLAALVGGIADSAAVIIAARAVMGLGAAFVMPATLSLISNIFAPDERGQAIAIWAGVAGAGGALGPVVSGLLITGWWIIPSGGWELALLYNVPIAIAVLVAVAVWVPRSRDPDRTPYDPLGAAASLVSLAALLFGIIEGPERGWSSPAVLGALGVAVASGAGFVWWENRAENPMLPLGLFADRRFAVGAAVNTVSFLALLGFWFLLVLYVQFSLGYSALQAGLATLPEAIVGMVIAPYTPILTGRFGAPRVMAAGFGALALGFGMLGFAGPTTSYFVLLAPITLAGIGLSLATIPATNEIMAVTPLSKSGVGSAVNDVSREIGAALGVAILGSISVVAYRRSIGVMVESDQLADAATESPGAGLEAAEELREAGDLATAEIDAAVTEIGRAFARAFGLSMTISGVVCALGAVAVIRLGRVGLRSAVR